MVNAHQFTTAGIEVQELDFTDHSTHALCIGSAHFDVLAKVTGDQGVVDKVGSIHVEVGGTGYNLAVNLRTVGDKVTFLTILPDRKMSNMLASEMLDVGMEPVIQREDTDQVAAFCAHISPEGEMRSAITSSLLDSYALDHELVFDAACKVEYVVADCNLSEQNLREVANTCTLLNKPLFIAGVSEAKVIRLEAIKGQFTAAFMNAIEAEALMISWSGGVDSIQDITRGTNSSIVVTHGIAGSVLHTANAQIKVPAVVSGNLVNTLGAGDLFMARAVHAHMAGLPLLHAMQFASAHIGDVLGKVSCNIGKSSVLERGLTRMSETLVRDELTNLYTRKYGAAEAKKIIDECHRYQKPCAVAFIDIDHFKRINDLNGHAAGDAVLTLAGNILQESFRGSDLVIRWGGEEFLIVLSDATLDQAEMAVRRTSVKLKDEANITVSVGLVSAKPGVPFDALIEMADQAVYIAKEAGRNRIVRA